MNPQNKHTIFSLLKRTLPQGECLIWQGRKTNSGYGLVGTQTYVHRSMYEKVFGSINPNLEIMHSCDTPTCINPWHLFQGTHKENMKQQTLRSRHNDATITMKDAQAIRAFYSTQSHYGLQRLLAKKYNTSTQVIDRVVRNITWRENL